MAGAIRADEVLRELEGGNQLFSAAHHYATVFGSPEDTNWAWMLTGHHMTAIFTVSGDRTAFTPMFTGSQPLQVPGGIYAGWQVLPKEPDRAGQLLASLSSDQQNAAIIGTSAPGDVVEGAGRQASLRSFQGIPSGRLDDTQQRLLWLLVEEFVRDAEFDATEAQLAVVHQTRADVHFGWQGPPPDPSASRAADEFRCGRPHPQHEGRPHVEVEPPNAAICTGAFSSRALRAPCRRQR